MKKIILSFLTISLLVSLYFSCKKIGAHSDTAGSSVPSNILSTLYAQGFDTTGVVKVNGGYVVEGDIFISNAIIGKSSSESLIIAKNEQYSTTNLITNLPQIITISTTNLPAAYAASVQEALNRYGALNLRFNFLQVANNGTINITNANLLQITDPDYIASTDPYIEGKSGFPPGNGNSYNQVGLNVAFFGQTPNADFLATIIAHELGHCIGFRHTDYMNSTFSCGASGGNEGAGAMGAVWIPGTPTGPDAASWMLACNGGVNRPFNANDVIAINFLYSVFYNDQTGAWFEKSCSPGQTGTWLYYNVPAAKWSSQVSKAAANQLATNDVNANGQNYVNQYGACHVGVQFQIYATGFNQGTGAVPNLVFTNTSTGEIYRTTPTSNYEGYYIPTGTFNISITQTNNAVFNASLPGYPNQQGQTLNFTNVVISGPMSLYITDK